MDFNIPFMKYRKIAAYASLALFVISIVSLSFRGLSLGLDFSGGTLVEVLMKTQSILKRSEACLPIMASMIIKLLILVPTGMCYKDCRSAWQ